MTNAEMKNDAVSRQAIADAVRAADKDDTEAYNELSLLSHNTVIDTIEIFEDEILIDSDGFRGPMVWHVTLNYRDEEEDIAESESFPGSFYGVFEDGVPRITRMEADTSYFYQ